MKTLVVLMLFIVFHNLVFSQEFRYDVFRTTLRTIDRTSLTQAHKLTDINPRFESSWINFYISVEMSVTVNGKVVVSKSKNDNITMEQIKLLQMADTWSNISVKVKYNPKNSLNDLKDVRELEFTYTVISDREAEFPGGYDKLIAYLKSMIEDKVGISPDELPQYADLSFVIDREGNVNDVKWIQSSGLASLDKLIYDTVCKMPKWTPAHDNDGTTFHQGLKFAFGTDRQSCYPGLVR